jgi:hypothetical protein
MCQSADVPMWQLANISAALRFIGTLAYQRIGTFTH